MVNNNIKIINNFEGAMIGNYSIENNNLFIQLKKEKPTLGYKKKEFDYNLHFNFGIKNNSQDDKEFNVFIDCTKEDELQHSIPWLWISNDSNNEYELVKNISGKTNFHGKYYFKFNIKGNQSTFIANFPPKNYNELKKEFEKLSSKTNALKFIIGKTVEDREIIAYEYGDIVNKPTLLFVSGFHPPERDTISIEAIMEKFLDKKWRKKVLNDFSISLIPILNPDGFANSMQGSNINGINFHWKFFGNTKNECPEAYNIWQYCKKIRPIVFFDFHAFTFQNNNARPYWIPEGFYISKKARLIQKYYNIKLSNLCGIKNNKTSRNETILAPTLLATRLRNIIGTITVPKFHLHMKDGIEKSKQMTVNCLEIILKGLYKYKLFSSKEILKFPYGNGKPYLSDIFRIKVLNIWFFYLIPILKKIMKIKN